MKFSPTAKRRLVKLAIAKYREYHKERLYVKSGAVQVYIPLTESWAAKFKSKNKSFETNQLTTYINQRRAARHGLGPIALCAFQFSHNGKIVTGYITEIVQAGYEKRFYGSDVENFPKCVRVVRRLYKMLGWAFGDCHSNNFGYKNGQLVCIDFDGVNGETIVKRLNLNRFSVRT